MAGWISIHRKIQNHWLWEDKPFSKAQAWIDLLLMANHEDSKFLLGNELINTKKGDVITSEVKLMQRWGWSKSKVRAFLLLLQNDSMITKKVDRKKTTLNIVNYCSWQETQTTKKPIKNHQQTTKEPIKDTINNSNNLNNLNKINNISSKVFVDDSMEMSFVNKMLFLIRINNPNHKEPNTQKWAKDFDLMLRIDERTPEEIERLISWSQQDNFWKGNILSPSKLREKYDQLIIQMNSRGRQTQKMTSDDAISTWSKMTEGYIK